MNTLRKSFVIALTALGMGTATLTVQADEMPHDRAAMHEADGAKHSERMAKHMAELHDKLKLSAAQEPAWATFVAAATSHGPAARPDQAAVAKMTAPERMEKWITLSQVRLAGQQNRLAALKTFYARLTPEQRKIVDDNMTGGMRGIRGGMHGNMKGGRHSGMHGGHGKMPGQKPVPGQQ